LTVVLRAPQRGLPRDVVNLGDALMGERGVGELVHGSPSGGWVAVSDGGKHAADLTGEPN
jgi:hypothetical protein